jgi:leucyl aminopeptidase
MTPKFAPAGTPSLPLYTVTPDNLDQVLSTLPDTARTWVENQKFKAGAGETMTLPDADGQTIGALVGLGGLAASKRQRFIAAAAATKLPGGVWRLENAPADVLEQTALGWLLHSYRFDRYNPRSSEPAQLVAPDGMDVTKIETIAAGECLTRDLINIPAAHMGPGELEQAARDLAETHGADIQVITGDTLLDQNFPMIHTVGRASPRAPRLIDMTWGKTGPKLTLVGKGVCFDTGGLNLKPGASMGLMKKDMGGAATVLGLAHMIMGLGLPVQLRVLIPAVENNVDGSAFRPGDILTSRSGKTVEINNTDAEGRLVLADALTYGDEAAPDLMISMATLTGAARVAVGPDLAPFFTDNETHAMHLTHAAARVADPVWRLPFYDPYEPMIEPGIADLDNAPKGGFAGSITAALFLRRFAGETPYMHFDIYGWNPTPAPARPKGGVGMGARARLDALPNMLDL